MSIMRCKAHDAPYDSDFQGCPYCETETAFTKDHSGTSRPSKDIREPRVLSEESFRDHRSSITDLPRI